MSQVDKKKSYWRSFGQLVKSKTYNLFLHKEFQEGASELKDDSRRRFIKLMGASAALAGVSGCGLRRPVQKIYPYAKMPEHMVPGEANFYASTLTLGRSAYGVLVESHQGRPTKIEGNPLHHDNQGALGSHQQAEILNLYDPDRLKTAQLNGKKISSEERDSYLENMFSEMIKSNGDSTGLLLQDTLSPSLYAALSRIKKRFSKIRFYKYAPINDDNLHFALKKLTGKSLDLSIDFSKANKILSFAADFLGADGDALPNERGFAERKDPDHEKGLNRLYMFESNFSVTGSRADHRFRVKSADISRVVVRFAQILMSLHSVSFDNRLALKINSQVVDTEELIKDSVLVEIAKDLLKNKGKNIILANSAAPEFVHQIIYFLNSSILSSQLVTYTENKYGNFSINRSKSSEQAKRLFEDLSSSKIDSLFIVGGNPKYNFPSNFNFGPSLKKLKHIVHLTDSLNETSELAHLVIPQSHNLESWGDVRSTSGVYSVVQPLINPMYDSISDLGLLLKISNYRGSSYRFVRSYWRGKLIGNFNEKWKSSLHSGVFDYDDKKIFAPSSNFNSYGFRILLPTDDSKVEINFISDYSMYDGRYANNGWLQEVPDPITKLTWDNAALISPAMAEKLNIQKLKGVSDIETIFQNPLPVAAIKVGFKTLEIPLFIIPGHADDSITVPVGYGRKTVGRVGEKTGFNTFYIKSSDSPWYDVVNNISITDKTYTLASTQEHGSMEGRPLYAQTTLEDYKKHPDFAKHLEHFPPMESLWEEHKYDTGYQWGMAIDLNKCSGCNACVVACQSENNIPIVGKEEVLNGREMHWLRMDRYFQGDKGEENPQLVHQPVTCLQCENAPCEQVCPVAATTHSEDGLNQMTYNRCIGTRYCANNCPVKVRRFNFFDYHQRNPQSVKKDKLHLFDYFKEPDKTVKMQHNPNVTVRMRGVMEKCTYCVQRIAKAKVTSKNENRKIFDGEVKVACQQTCAANAIVFGDINDPKSEVSKLKEKQRDYHILKGLHLKARTSYLAAITNPNEKINKLLGYTKKQEVH